MNLRVKLPSRYYTYIAVSNVAAVGLTLDAFLTFGQVFAAISFLTTSRVFHVLLANVVLANVLLATSAIRKVFFGELLPPERVQMHEMFFSVLISSAIGLSFFSHLLDRWMMVSFVLTGGWRMFHTLAASRLDSIERAPVRPHRQVMRLAAFLFVAAVVDTMGAIGAAQKVFSATAPSVHLLFLVNFSNMSLHAMTTMLKLFLVLRADDVPAGEHQVADDANGGVRDGAGAGGFQGDGATRFYVDAISSVFEFLINAVFFLTVMRIAFPLHLARDLLTSWSHASAALRGLRRYRRLASNIDHAFPDATVEDLERDARCAVCYDDMSAGSSCKRLSCGHCYHKNCLRRWFEKNSSCPYCRKEIELQNIAAPAVARQPDPLPPPIPVAPAAPLFDVAPREMPPSPPPAPPILRDDGIPAPPVVRSDVSGEPRGDTVVSDAEKEEIIQRAYAEYLQSTQPLSLSSPQDLMQERIDAYAEYHAAIQSAEAKLRFRLALVDAVVTPK